MKLWLYRGAKAITATKRLYGVSTTLHKDEDPAVLTLFTFFHFTHLWLKSCGLYFSPSSCYEISASLGLLVERSGELEAYSNCAHSLLPLFVECLYRCDEGQLVQLSERAPNYFNPISHLLKNTTLGCADYAIELDQDGEPICDRDTNISQRR